MAAAVKYHLYHDADSSESLCVAAGRKWWPKQSTRWANVPGDHCAASA